MLLMQALVLEEDSEEDSVVQAGEVETAQPVAADEALLALMEARTLRAETAARVVFRGPSASSKGTRSR